ncbi:Ras GTPase [Clydaea vesicula]|uniref:Ras GTPase n=1 Tax=Clydaea vesicula TaxID=447962 RepID=A0AAD5TZT8_9FUNG|nr:Ras GTPase [Clydaea vesicula]
MLLVNDKGELTHLEVLVFGAAHVGKTALINSFLNSSQPSPNYDPTIEEQHCFYYNKIVLSIQDVGGHPFYSAIWSSAILAADAFLLVYDVGEKRSFDLIWPLYKQIIQLKLTRNVPILLVGNMVDTIVNTRQRQVSSEKAQNFAKILNIPSLETTAKAPHSVSHCFKTLIELAKKTTINLVKEDLVELSYSRRNDVNNLNQSKSVPLLSTTLSSNNSTLVSNSSHSSSENIPRSISKTSKTSLLENEDSNESGKKLNLETEEKNFLNKNHESSIFSFADKTTLEREEKKSENSTAIPTSTIERNKVAKGSFMLEPLPPPAKNSIRGRRDVVFSNWKKFKNKKESDVLDSRLNNQNNTLDKSDFNFLHEIKDSGVFLKSHINLNYAGNQKKINNSKSDLKIRTNLSNIKENIMQNEDYETPQEKELDFEQRLINKSTKAKMIMNLSNSFNSIEEDIVDSIQQESCQYNNKYVANDHSDERNLRNIEENGIYFDEEEEKDFFSSSPIIAEKAYTSNTDLVPGGEQKAKFSIKKMKSLQFIFNKKK